ncbi:MAG: HAMP domain-containing histidine kinase [Candidatus Firestonebacteria bacterium]|nr:HAMP domain-containing histidine kinase [Candidatus Firestonebacteria bacterium]
MHKPFRISLQWQILAASLAALTLGAGLYTWITDNLMISAMDRQLGKRLEIVAQLFRQELPWKRLVLYLPGDQSTRSHQEDQNRLRQFNLRGGLERSSLLDAGGRVLIDSADANPGDYLENIAPGRETLLHRNAQGRWSKIYYFPLGQGECLRLEAGREMLAYLDTLQTRRWLALGAGACLAVLLSLGLARWLGRRLARLSDAFLRLQRGEPGVTLQAAGEDEIAFVSRGFNTMARELEERQQRERTEHERRVSELRMLAGGIAHEIRNPLGALAALGEWLARRPALQADAESRDLLTRLRGEIDRMDLLVGDVLAYARQPRLNLTWQTVEHLLTTAALADPNCRLELTPPYPALSVDETGILTVLRNLIINARAAAGPQGEVRVGARARRGRVLFYVADDGPGIPASARDAVFQPFFTQKPKGAGLGLAIARNIMEAHHGQLRPGTPSRGALLVAWLPAREGG